jgi:hypothetical protein
MSSSPVHFHVAFQTGSSSTQAFSLTKAPEGWTAAPVLPSASVNTGSLGTGTSAPDKATVESMMSALHSAACMAAKGSGLPPRVVGLNSIGYGIAGKTSTRNVDSGPVLASLSNGDVFVQPSPLLSMMIDIVTEVHDYHDVFWIANRNRKLQLAGKNVNLSGQHIEALGHPDCAAVFPNEVTLAMKNYTAVVDMGGGSAAMYTRGGGAGFRDTGSRALSKNSPAGDISPNTRLKEGADNATLVASVSSASWDRAQMPEGRALIIQTGNARAAYYSGSRAKQTTADSRVTSTAGYDHVYLSHRDEAWLEGLAFASLLQTACPEAPIGHGFDLWTFPFSLTQLLSPDDVLHQ